MHGMDLWHLVAIIVAGILAGAVNTVAGGGSLISVPALIFAGLPAPVANATNRLGVIVQSATASIQFARSGALDARQALHALIPTGMGAVMGAFLSVDIDEALFEKIIGAAMLLMLLALFIRPKRWLEGKPSAARWRGWRFLGFLAIGVYGGFLQAGVGIFLLAALVVFGGQDLVRANASKVLLVALFTVPPLAIYLYYDLVAWLPGLGLAAGSTLGAWLGARITVSWGPRFVRWVLTVVICTASTRLLGLW